MKKFAFLAAFGLLWIGCKSADDSGTTTTTGSTTPPANGGSTTASFASVSELLNSKCLPCHGEGGKEGIDVRSYASLMKGGEDGPIVKAGDAAGSKIVHVLKETDTSKRMPKNQPPLEAAQIKMIEDWIAAGAKES